MSNGVVKEGQPMREAVRHLRLDTDHHIHGRRTHFIAEGTDVLIGTASTEQVAKMGKQIIHINDTSGLVDEFHGRIRFEKNGTLSYTHLTDKPTFLVDADGKTALTITEKNLKIAIDPSQTLALPDHTKISFMVPRVEIKVSEPEVKAPQMQAVVQPQIKENEWEEIVEIAGTRNASVTKSFINRVYEILVKEREESKGRVVILPKEGYAILVGDIHSRPECLEPPVEEFRKMLSEGKKAYLIFLGDYSDRPRVLGDGGGAKVNEIISHLKIKFPNNVFALVGNHDDPVEGMSDHEFPDELKIKYGEKDGSEIYNKYRELFKQAPIAVIMPNVGIAIHGGPSPTVKSLRDLANPTEETKEQVTWSDPNPHVTGYEFNSARGIGSVFGPDALNAFLNIVGIPNGVMVRAHEQRVSHEFNGKCLTLNSTDYKNAVKAYAVVDLSQEIHNTNQIKINYF